MFLVVVIVLAKAEREPSNKIPALADSISFAIFVSLAMP